jgi:hypothetical protein
MKARREVMGFFIVQLSAQVNGLKTIGIHIFRH